MKKSVRNAKIYDITKNPVSYVISNLQSVNRLTYQALKLQTNNNFCCFEGKGFAEFDENLGYWKKKIFEKTITYIGKKNRKKHYPSKTL